MAFSRERYRATPAGDPLGLSTNLRAIERTMPYASVVADFRDIAADPRGITDDTDKINRLLDQVGDAGGGVVYAPPGTYKITHLTIPANTTLAGAGRGATLFDRYANTSETGHPNLFGIRLAGNHAGIRHCSIKGRWDPSTPTTQTFETLLAVYGHDVQHTLAFDVELYHAHLGYLVGGLVNSPTASFHGQHYSRAIACYAHDTYDLGFGLLAEGTADDETTIGCAIIDCWQEDSYATAGCEVRFQRAAQVIGFNARNNSNASLGAGVRLEETSHARITNLQASSCGMGVQVINDSSYCAIDGLTFRGGDYGVYVRHSADIQINQPSIHNANKDGIILAYSDGTAWTRNNQRVSVIGGEIADCGQTTFGYGIHVVGTGFTEAALEDNGKGLVVRGTRIYGVHGNGIYIRAGGNFSVVGAVLEDNQGTGTDGVGIVVDHPNPGGVTDTAKPAAGYIGDCVFVTTGVQDFTVTDPTGLTAYGHLKNIGGATQPSVTHLDSAAEPGNITHKGWFAEIRTIGASDSPYTMKATDVTVRANATSGAITVNLPAAASHEGRVYVIKKTDASANAVTIDGNGAETIDGAATVAIGTQYQARLVQSDGSNWNVVGAYL